VRPHPPLHGYYDGDEERVRKLRRWFDDSAPAYDQITQAMSFGSGHWYRRRVLDRAGVASGARVLDVACGTGVLAEAARRLVGDGGRVVALDPSTGMLMVARRRGAGELVRGTAEALPFADASFDLVTMGYALRHVADLTRTFDEYRRVLKPGGRVLILEITPPRSRLLSRLLTVYLGRVVPALAGHHGASARELMAYYWETIAQCVAPAAILGALGGSGFADARRRVDLGIFSEYVAIVAP
jgi:demethylmenaquinone methyltransferase/2-methoxy-6-polyprenyl-1,4-benzoquinol methylase